MRNTSLLSTVLHLTSPRSMACMALALALLAGCQSTVATPSAPDPKIATEVTAALSQLKAGQALDPQRARSDAEGRLEVYVYVKETSAATVQALVASGLKSPTPSPMGLVQGWIAPGDLDALAAIPAVVRITLPRYATHH